MRTSIARGLLLVATLSLPLGASALTAVDWTSATGGTANGIEVTVSGLVDPLISTADLSGSPFDGARLSEDAEVLSYGTRSQWTLTLSEPVDALLLYAVGWRGTDAGVDPTNYHFDTDFTLFAGFFNADVAGGLILSLNRFSLHDGILQFCGPISSLTLESNVPAESALGQALTLAVAPLPAEPPSVVPFDWATPTDGTADGIVASLSGLDDPSLEPADLSLPAFTTEPLSFCSESISYSVGSDWTLAFSEPVEALLLYARFWRGSVSGASPVTYQFDAPFTIVSGLEDASVSNGGTLLTLSDNFHDGILRFDGPLESLAVDTNADEASKQTMTFALVPEPAAVLAGPVALAALLGLRRRA
jgi:hypothetical protein